jgi:4a-hydroxytetrahydrobiopterin dehydratase
MSKSGWRQAGGKLKRRFEFSDFAGALAFVNQVAALAEAANHHPDISFGWGWVEISLTSHDKAAVTETDHALAAKIDQL